MTVEELISILNPTYGQLITSMDVDFYIYIDGQKTQLDSIFYKKGTFHGNWKSAYVYGHPKINDSKVDEPSVIKWVFEK